MQKKDLSLAQCEIKFAPDKPTRFSGYASVFGGVDAYGDTIIRGAFKDTLANRTSPIMMLYGHNMGRVPGKWLAHNEDDKGLFVDGELTPGNTESENVAASLRHGAITGLSIGYRIPAGGAEDREGGRLLKQIDLVEISIVSMPADDSARIELASVKDAIDLVKSISDAEDFLRDAGGFSRNAAKTFFSRLKTVYLRDAGAEIEQLRKALVQAETRALLAETRFN